MSRIVAATVEPPKQAFVVRVPDHLTSRDELFDALAEGLRFPYSGAIGTRSWICSATYIGSRSTRSGSFILKCQPDSVTFGSHIETCSRMPWHVGTRPCREDSRTVRR